LHTVKLDAAPGLKLEEALSLAAREAAKHTADPMLLGWLDRTTGRHSPDVDCCQAEGKETWEIYAESRGGNVRIEFGDTYVFIFREGLQSR
jgi:hypothetical protein